ncbi:hypothetical protein LHP98_09360 [Rhodobacter sp. Har01]|uniref:hypothetical protein n=1 Tax=Rhodobacter sp. Har01 TaxID=2883999 RepID=UPI001D068331|nr:hypothetical protein [Rhodobacter sp. Har01]MCB6178337.1 hypothetical protein [Rhodobacter sp. Har01]
MFTIEHEFDATVVTLIDEGDGLPLMGDVVISGFEDCVTVEQTDPDTDEVQRITLSMTQIADLAAALNLPEGSYRIDRAPKA